MRLNPDHFEKWFHAINGYNPFPWQRRLFRDWLCPQDQSESRWPKTFSLPTACGKTALIDIAVLALAAGASCARRRIAFVVDRRVVVDEASERARRLERKLDGALNSDKDDLKEVAESLMDLGGEKPLVVVTLRGGVIVDDAWARSPLQPAVILSTVDQVGSRLLFRAYGPYSNHSWPIHAGLLGKDTLIIVDEAHCAAPFCETVNLVVEKWQDFAEMQVGKPISLVMMSATLTEKTEFKLDEEDLRDPEIKRRVSASKRAKLIQVKSKRDGDREALVEKVIEESNRLLEDADCGTIGVVVNRVADARRVFESLRLPEDRKILLTGRVRGWERDHLLFEWLPRIRAGSKERTDQPVAVVSTQCIEVGANLDFDALVTEAASLDALRQRFGRLNRLGLRPSSSAFVIATDSQVSGKEGAAKNPDPIYGQTIYRTWEWLKSISDDGYVDFGIESMELPDPDKLSELCMKTEMNYVLLPAHLDLLSQTSPPPYQSPEISAYLHGSVKRSPDVTVIWRCDLEEDNKDSWIDRVSIQPPSTGEGCPVPIWEFKKWLAGASIEKDAGDVESADYGDDDPAAEKNVLRWYGPEDSEVVSAKDVRPGDVVVVPSSYGGCDRFGWNPLFQDFVEDIGDAVAAGHKKPVLRIDAAIGLIKRRTDEYRQALDALKDMRRFAEEDPEAPSLEESLRRIIDAESAPSWMRDLATKLVDKGPLMIIDAGGAYALMNRGDQTRRASIKTPKPGAGQEVGLEEHSEGVRAYAERFSIGLPDEIRSDVSLAAWLHDVGKADYRFQVYLHGGNEIRAALAETLLAKSSLSERQRIAVEQARSVAGYPKGGRHEAQSVALAQENGEIMSKAKDPDLVLHLIASHHGRARPFFPYVEDAQPVEVSLHFEGMTLSASSDHGMYRLDSGVPERYFRLVRKYGWWGLAYIEAIVRLADHRRSEYEEVGGL